jgi:hypothetical protein
MITTDTVFIRGWIVHLCVDDDNHLNLNIHNEDGTEIFDNSEDNSGENEIAFRLTSQQIEDDYKQFGDPV